MTAVLCIGETKEEYETGQAKRVCARQLAAALEGVEADEMNKVIIAYEPVWAIGTGLTATPAIAQSVHAGIRDWFRQTYGEAVASKVRIQYGGSVKPETVDELMEAPDVDGCLVGARRSTPNNSGASSASTRPRRDRQRFGQKRSSRAGTSSANRRFGRKSVRCSTGSTRLRGVVQLGLEERATANEFRRNPGMCRASL